MTLEDLIRRFRVLAQDNAQPYLWPDDDVTDWLNDAQRHACVRGRLIREDANPAVCQVALEPGRSTYPLHKSLYEIIHLALVPTTGEPITLSLQSREWLDATTPNWRFAAGRRPEFAVQNDTSLRIVGDIHAGDVLHIECYRLPLKIMVNEADKPEIHEAHHEHLIHWALHRAFSKPDADTFDANRAALADAAFTRYFGLQPDSDMRRATRHDVAHHVALILP